MRRSSAILVASVFSALILFSCKTIYQAEKVTYNDYSISGGAKQDSSLLNLLQPYRDSVNKSMNTVIAVAAITMERKQPEGPLGNLMVDGMMVMAKKHFTQPIDIAILNHGGIRLPSIAAGDITRGKIFEAAPFDNVIVLLKMNGKTLQQFLDHVSNKGGWPANNINWQIKDKKAINVNIAGKPMDENATYTMATIDYLANGGDDCAMLRPIPKVNDGYIFRTAILEYLSQLTREGKSISAKIENRVTDAN